MRRLPRGRALGVAAVAAVVVVGALAYAGIRLTHGASTPATTSQAPPPPESFALPGCYNLSAPPVERPRRLSILGCASVAVAVQDMSWSSWGPQGADGTGTAVFKICDPNCAAGYQLTNPVVVHAWNPQSPRADAICEAGLKIFADVILAFPKGAPPPTAQKMNSQYNGMPAVHYANYQGGSNRDAQFIGYTFCN
ncbi:hypothetical protein [Mycobacterium sp. 050134]|uniref:hypothetical protein n=1 Tax=Mycobacterium sp. 050134 TaxID=3096111 RepID=UPI003FA583C2